MCCYASSEADSEMNVNRFKNLIFSVGLVCLLLTPVTGFGQEGDPELGNRVRRYALLMGANDGGPNPPTVRAQ